MFFSAHLETLGLHSLMVNRMQDLTSDIVSDLRCNREAHTFRIGPCFRGRFESGPASKQVPKRGGFFSCSLLKSSSSADSRVWYSPPAPGISTDLLFFLTSRVASPPQSIHHTYKCNADAGQLEGDGGAGITLSVCICCTFRSLCFSGPLCRPVVHIL